MSTPKSTTIPAGYKRCSKGDACLTVGGPVLMLDHFGKNKAEKDGINRYCWECHRANNRKYVGKWRETHRDEHRAASKRHMKAYPDAQYRRNRKWVETHRDHARLLSRKGSQRRRARKQLLAATLTQAEWQHALDYFGHTCAVCGHNSKLAQDHWIPVVSGGGYVRDNIIPLCRSCNSSKHDTDPLVWLADRFAPADAAAILARVQAYFASLVIY